MKRRGALGLLAALPLGAFGRRAEAASQAEVLSGAAFIDEHNAPHSLSEVPAPLVLVNLWAAWCAGCLAELPTLRTLRASLGPGAMDVVLVSHEMNWRGDLVYARDARLPFRHWRLSPEVTPAAEAIAFGFERDRFGLPQTLVFAGHPRGLVASYLGSRDWADPGQVRLAETWLRTSG